MHQKHLLVDRKGSITCAVVPVKNRRKHLGWSALVIFILWWRHSKRPKQYVLGSSKLSLRSPANATGGLTGVGRYWSWCWSLGQCFREVRSLKTCVPRKDRHSALSRHSDSILSFLDTLTKDLDTFAVFASWLQAQGVCGDLGPVLVERCSLKGRESDVWAPKGRPPAQITSDDQWWPGKRQMGLLCSTPPGHAVCPAWQRPWSMTWPLRRLRVMKMTQGPAAAGLWHTSISKGR